MATDNEFPEILAEHGWQVVSTDLQTPGSPWIGRAVDGKGRPHIVKMIPEDPLKIREPEALKAFRSSQRVPRAQRLTKEGNLIAVQDLGGETLGQALQRLGVHTPGGIRMVGRSAKLAKRLHSCPPYEGEGDLVSTKQLLELRNLPLDLTKELMDEDLALRLEWVYQQLMGKEHEHFFVHGDLHCLNVVYAADRLWAIDPYGAVGDRALDLGMLAAFTEDPLSVHAHLVDIYQRKNNTKIPRTKLWLAWCCGIAVRQDPNNWPINRPNLEAAIRSLVPDKHIH